MAEAIKAILAGRSDAVTIAPLTNRLDYNAVIRSTCVPTQMTAAHVENAPPANGAHHRELPYPA
jgi:hypothetical protein